MIKNITLFYREGSSDKIYKANITEDSIGFTVNFAYGRRGNTLILGTKTPKPIPFNQAEKIYNKLIQEKTAKGYQEDPNGKPFAGTITEVRDSGFRPQLLNEISKEEVEFYLTNDDWCAQEKYDGRRRSLVIQDSTVIGTNRKGLAVVIDKDLEREALSNRLTDPSNYILDGEAMDNILMVFDIPIIGKSYKERYKLLKEVFNTRKNIMVTMKLVQTAWTTKEKKELYKRLQEDNAEGIVFKNINAGFIPGRPNSGGDHLKFKFVATATCMVSKTNSEKRSVSIAVYNSKGDLVEIGNVTIYPNQEIPKPGDIIEVRYLYYFTGGSLFQTVFLGKRDDMSLEDCTLAQLKEKREEEITQ